MEIYYFSGTGNSLSVARALAEKLGGKLIAISSVVDKEGIQIEAESVGLVFPVYYATNDCGIPLIVSRFIKKLGRISSKYVFAVCTYGYMAGTTIENLQKLFRSHDGDLAAGFTIKMSNKMLPKEKQQKMSANQKRKLDAICAYVTVQRSGKFETRSKLHKAIFAPLLLLAIKPVFLHRYRKLSNSPRLPFSELIPLADRSFQVNQNCNGCGLCAKVCPVNNIKMVEGRPVWQHHCETCYACYGWCSQGAIGGKIVSYNERYHHLDVTISDMIRQTQPQVPPEFH